MILKSLLALMTSANLLAAAPLVYEGTEGPGKGKHIVFIANDHEYRSEETCPLIAKILAKHHGFKCTVLFGMDENGHIKGGGTPIPNIDVLPVAGLNVYDILRRKTLVITKEAAEGIQARFDGSKEA